MVEFSPPAFTICGGIPSLSEAFSQERDMWSVVEFSPAAFTICGGIPSLSEAFPQERESMGYRISCRCPVREFSLPSLHHLWWNPVTGGSSSSYCCGALCGRPVFSRMALSFVLPGAFPQ